MNRLAIAAIGVLTTLVVVGVLTSPETETNEPVTTTTSRIDPPVDTEGFAVSQISRGEPIQWESSLVVPDGFPLTVLDHGDEIYLFAIDAPDFTGFPAGGLRAWKSVDGVSWEYLGQVIDEGHVISAVSSTGQRLVALEPGEAGTGFTVWRSPDGVEWKSEDVAVDASSDLIVMRPVSTGGTDGLLVVSGTEQLHISDLIEERLGEHYGDSVQMGPYGWSTDISFEGELQFTLYGPVGLPLAFVTAHELGLTDSERALIAETYEGTDRQSIWVETDSGWTIREIPDADVIQWIGNTPDGRVIAIGYGRSGLNAWGTRDGSSWESLPSFPGPYHIDNWAHRIVGPSNTRDASVLVSNGDGSWNDIGPAGHFPDDLDWSVGGLGAGPGGVAAIINGWGDIGGSPTPVDLPTLRDGDTTLTLQFRSGEYVLETADNSDVVYNWSMGGEPPLGMSADLKAGTLSFSDPDTGEPLGKFDFGDINEAAHVYWSQQGSRENVQAFAFTDEPIDWTIQDVTEALGDIEVSQVEVTSSHVVAAGIHQGFNPTTAPGFEVWIGEIP